MNLFYNIGVDNFLYIWTSFLQLKDDSPREVEMGPIAHNEAYDI